MNILPVRLVLISAGVNSSIVDPLNINLWYNKRKPFNDIIGPFPAPTSSSTQPFDVSSRFAATFIDPEPIPFLVLS